MATMGLLVSVVAAALTAALSRFPALGRMMTPSCSPTDSALADHPDRGTTDAGSTG